MEEKKEEEEKENCHVLTTARRADEGRGKNIPTSSYIYLEDKMFLSIKTTL